MNFPRVVRRSLVGVFAIALSLAIGAAALIWILSQPRAFTWLAQQAVAYSGGELKLDGVKGNLWKHFYIGQLHYEDPNRIVDIAGLDFWWRGRRLLDGRVWIDKIKWRDARYESKTTDKKPPPLPASLRLPVSLRVDRIEGPLTVVTNSVPIKFARLSVSLYQRNELYDMRINNLDTPFGRFAGGARVGIERPFKLDGAINIRGSRRDVSYAGRLALSGGLAKLGVSAILEVREQRASANVVLTPFKATVIDSFVARAQKFDPSAMNAAWPKAAIDLEASGSFTERDAVRAAFSLRNRLVGALNAGRVPIRSISGSATGTAENGQLAGMTIDLGEAGSFTGSGGWAGNTWRLQLETRELNVKKLDDRLAATRLKGTVALAGDKKSQNISADLTQPGYNFALTAIKTGDLLAMSALNLSAGDAQLRASGRIDLALPRSYKASAQLSHFDPKRFGSFPVADINASFDLSGTLGKTPLTRVAFNIGKSTLNKWPLGGSGKVTVTGDRLEKSDVDLVLAGNVLHASGGIGRTQDRLRFNVSAPYLNRLGKRFNGTLKAEGAVAGTWSHPTVQASIEAVNIRVLDVFKAASVSAKIDIGFKANAPFEINVVGRDIVAKKNRLDIVRVQSHGRLERHRFEASLQGPSVNLVFAAEGGWQPSTGWSGRLNRLRVTQPILVELMAPIPLQARPQHFSTRDVGLRVAQGVVSVKYLRWNDGLLDSEGGASAISLKALLTAFGVANAKQYPLVLDAKWNIKAGSDMNGFLQISRRSGDIVLKDPRVLPLQLRTLEVRAVARRNTLTATLQATGERVGQISGNVSARLSKEGGPWSLPPDAPISGSLRARTESIAWLGLLTKPAEVDGRLQLSVSIGGTVANPSLRGTAIGDALKVTFAEQGLNFKDGRLRADFVGDRIEIRQLIFSAGKGTLQANGALSLRDSRPDVNLRWSAKSLEILSSPDRKLVVSGSGNIKLIDKQVNVVGNLIVDRGIIELPDTTERRLSSDIVILGKTKEHKKARVPYAVKADLMLDLGDNFVAKGRGLDAKLKGKVRITAMGGDVPRATGTISIAKGTYSIYGRTLELDKGTINFAGPIDNPSIYVVARRKTSLVNAGVEVSGTVNAPKVRLVSSPPMQDTEILSWLVLGHGLGDSSGSELGLLQAAAGALLAKGESTTLQAKLAAATGLDEIAIREGSSALAGTIVALGKQLSSRLYLTFEQGLATSESVLSLRYQISKRLSLRLQGGSDNALDLFYTISYD